MKETKKYDNWIKFLTVSVIMIIVCVLTLTVSNTHLIKDTYSEDNCIANSACTLNVTFDANGGTGGGVLECTISNTGGHCSVKAPTATRSGYNFNGWGSSASCTEGQFYANASVVVGSNVTYYACWKKSDSSSPTTSCNPDTVDSVTEECTALHRTFNNSTCACGNCINGYILEYGQCVPAPASSPCNADTVDSVTEECTALHRKFNSGTCACGDCMDGYVLQNGSCVASSDCDITVSTRSVNVSVDADGVDNSYYTVSVSYTGSCKGQTITYSATNAKRLSSTTYLITTSTAGITTFNVYPSDPCVTSVATAKLANGKSSSTSAVSTRTDWVSSDDCVENPTYKSFAEADRAGSNVYYSDPGTCNGHSGWYTKKWVRNGCGGSNSDPTPTGSTPTGSNPTGSNPTSTSSTSYSCYLVNHKYVWAKSKPNGGTLVTSKTTQSSCGGCESGYLMDNSNNCVKPSSSASSNVSVNPKTGTIGIVVAWIAGLSAILYSLWYFKKSSSIK